ncbi:uncharacterized protein LOC144389770 [Gasterosteus aculeatus]
MSNVQKKQIMVEKRDLNSKEVDPPVNFYLRSLEEQVRAELDSNAMLTQTQCEGRVLLQIDKDRLQQFLDLLPEKKTGEVQKEICQKTQLKASRPKLQKTQGDVEGQTPKTKIQCVDLKMKGEKQLLPNFEETISKENLELKGQLEWMLKVSAEMKLAKTNTEIELESQLEIERAQTEKLRIELAEALKNQEGSAIRMRERFQAFHNTQMYNWKLENNGIAAALKAAQDELQAERMKGEKPALQNDAEAKELKPQAKGKWIAAADRKENWKLKSQLEIERAKTKKQHIELTKLAEALKNKEEAVKQVKELFQAFQEDTMSKQRAERDKMAAALKASQDLLKSEHFTTQQMTTNQGEMQQFKASSQAKLDEQRDAIIKLKAALEKSEQDLKAGHLQWQQEKVSLKEHCVHLSHSEGQHMGTQTHAVDQEMDEQREETIRILATLKATQDELQAERMKGEKQALQNDMEAMMLKVRAELKLAKTNVEFELESQLENERAQTKKQQIEISKLAEALKNKEEAVKQVKELFQAFQEDTMSKQRAERDKMAAALKASQDLLKSEHFTTQQMTTNQGEMQQFKASSQAKLDEQRDAIIKLKAALEKSEQDLKAGHLQWQQEKVSLKEHCVHLSHSEGQHMGTQTHAVDQEMDEQREETIRILATLKATQDELQAERMKGEKQALQNDMEAMMLKVRAELKLAKTNVEFELESQLENERAQTKKQQIEISKLAEALKNKEEAVKQVKELFQAFQEDTMSKQRAERDKMAAALKASQDLLKSEQMTTNQGEMQQFKASSQAKLDEQRDAIIKLKAALEKSEQDLKAGHLQWQQEKVSLKEHCVHLSHSEGQHMGTQTHAVDQEMDEQREETIRILATLKATQDELQAERMKGEKQALQNDVEAMMLKVRAELKLAKTNVEFELESQLEIERAQTKKQQIEISTLAEALKNKEEAVKQVKELFQAFQEDTMSKQRAERDKMAAALKASQDLLKSEQMTTNQGEMQQFKASSQAKLDEQTQINESTKAALLKSEHCLHNARLEWQKERSSLTEVRDVLQAQVKTETEAKQTLERIISAHQGQLEEQKAKSNETLLAMKVINVRLETQRQENSFLTAQLQTQDTVSKSRTIEWEQERSHLTARLNKTSTDLEHALLRNVTLFQTMEKEAAETFERNQASQEQLISTIRKDKDDSLERQRLSFQDMISHLETSNRNCVTKQETQEEDHKNLLASLIKKFEDDRESKRHEWNQERSDLLKISKQSLAREEEYQENNISLSSHVEALQCQINKPKKKWYKLF